MTTRRDIGEAITQARLAAMEAKLLLDEQLTRDIRERKLASPDLDASKILGAIDLLFEQTERRFF